MTPVERYARAFDEISRKQDAHYSALSFVRWVRLEASTLRRGSASYALTFSARVPSFEAASQTGL